MASRQHHGPRNYRITSANGAATTAASNSANTSEPVRNDNDRTTGRTASGPGPPTHSTVQQDDAPSTVRRNLFPQNQTRRVPSSSSTASTTASRSASATIPATGNTSKPTSSSAGPTTKPNAPAMAADRGTATNGNTLPSATSSLPPKSGPTTALSLSTAPVDGDIVARDTNGCYKVDVPTLPVRTSGEDAEEENGSVMEGIETADSAAAGTSSMDVDEALSGVTQEKLDGTINEMMRRHRSRQTTDGEPPEVFLLIQENLKNKVAELDEDKWMYEIEDEIRA